MAFSHHIPQVVYGGFDGTVTTFAVIAAAAGAGLISPIVIVLGAANLIADGFSMGASSYLSRKSENRKAANKHQRPFSVATATFIAFVLVGALPLLPYLYDVLVPGDIASGTLFLVSSALALVAFIAVGISKGRARSGKYATAKSLLETIILGGIAAALAYFLGDFLSGLFGL